MTFPSNRNEVVSAFIVLFHHLYVQRHSDCNQLYHLLLITAGTMDQKMKMCS